ncbi:MAG TPA: protein kinase [Actinomycetota bacterium]|nr:protein kinase [Actinomycetota bacterium]
MPLAPGRRLGPYEIVSSLGAGGMGEVYEARDTRLGRTVAIKVLPEDLADDPARRVRFEREARAVSQLAHPHVCTLYDVGEAEGVHFLVMEHLEGETLRSRLKRGPVPVDEALRIAAEIADALDEAHRHGVVHRDLKPGNLMLTEGGSTKVLDFGLARLVAETGAEDLTEAVTLDAAVTATGTILGTVAYMSPEQARSEPADQRSDLWALGVILWEMLTGERPFRATTAPQTLSAILEEEPPWSELPRNLAPAGERLLRRCLAKEPDQRLHHAADARLEIEEAQRGLRAGLGERRRAAFPIRTHSLAAFAAGLVVGGVLGWWMVRGDASPSRPLTLHLELPPGQELTSDLAVTIDPEGREIVYSAVGEDGTARLYRRPLDRDEIIPLAGTEEAIAPFFSPDGEWVGFLSGAELRKVRLAGGPVLPVTRVPSGELLGGTWLPDGTIVFSAGVSSGLLAVDSQGGEAEVLTEPDPQAVERGHWYPSSIPGRPAVLFTVDTPSPQTAMFDLEERKRVTITEGVNAQYVSTGELIFRRGGSLMAAPFDLGALRLTGPPRPVPHPIRPHPESAGFAVAPDGTLVSAVVPGGGGGRLVFVGRNGSPASITAETRVHDHPRLSPDGRWIAFEEGLDLWLHSLDRNSSQPFVVPGWATAPVWSPDGETVAFSWTTATSRALALQRLGATEPEVLFESLVGGPLPTSWSRDGRYLVFYLQRPEAGRDLWVLPLEGERKAFPFLATPHNERAGVLSPDGRWIAYVSNLSGDDEVYLSPFPEHGGRRWQVSSGGGLEPRWSPDGREITFRQGDDLLVVEVSSGNGRPVLGRSERLFHLPYPANLHVAQYDPAPDGTFLMEEVAEGDLERIVISFDRLARGSSAKPP